MANMLTTNSARPARTRLVNNITVPAMARRINKLDGSVKKNSVLETMKYMTPRCRRQSRCLRHAA